MQRGFANPNPAQRPNHPQCTHQLPEIVRWIHRIVGPVFATLMVPVEVHSSLRIHGAAYDWQQADAGLRDGGTR